MKKEMNDFKGDQFQGKQEQRFVVEIPTIPVWAVYSIDRPKQIQFMNNKFYCCDLYNQKIIHQFCLYDTIDPSTAHLILNLIKEQKQNIGDIIIKEISPTGNIIFKWKYVSVNVKDITFSSLNWNGNNINLIRANFDFDCVEFE